MVLQYNGLYLPVSSRSQLQVGRGLQLQPPVENPYCSCRLTRVRPRLQAAVHGGPHCINTDGKHLYCGPTGKW